MRKLFLATGNKDKIAEIRRILADLPFRVVTVDDRPGLPEVIEDRDTLEGNASKKALALARATGLLSLADDTGLMVDALGGAPGVFSSRYAGEDATYADNCEKLLREMESVPDGERTAHFATVAAVALPTGVIGTAEGRVDGVILRQARGTGGFGYDPLFYHEPSKGTFAEITAEVKNRVSHRAAAMEGAKKILARLVEGNLE